MIAVTLIEKKRKDFVEMMLHHVMTASLIFSSYCFNYTRMETAVLVEKDFADIFLPLAIIYSNIIIFLPLAKMLKYANFSNHFF